MCAVFGTVVVLGLAFSNSTVEFPNSCGQAGEMGAHYMFLFEQRPEKPETYE
jgi:hypothetical protein